MNDETAVDGAQPARTDSPVTAEEIYAITLDDVLKFLNEREKPGHGKCPVCETDSWASLTPAEGGTVNLIVGDVEGLIGKGAIHCVALTCNHCGYVRTHSVLPMIHWKRSIK